MKAQESPKPALESRSLAKVAFDNRMMWNRYESGWDDGTVYGATTGQTASARATSGSVNLHLRVDCGSAIAGRSLALVRRKA
jgi:hypothetical protein